VVGEFFDRLRIAVDEQRPQMRIFLDQTFDRQLSIPESRAGGSVTWKRQLSSE
jgi:hypothetical protein